jgi:hypothetical protein
MPKTRHNGAVDIERDASPGTPLWRDPLSLSFRAHRQVLLMKLRWHARRDVATDRRRPLSRARRAEHRP